MAADKISIMGMASVKLANPENSLALIANPEISRIWTGRSDKGFG